MSVSRKGNSYSTAIIVCVLLVFIGALNVFSQEWKGSGRVYGSVSAPDGSPIKDCKVVLIHTLYNDGPTTKTDEEGKWVVMGIRGGTWKIDFIHPDYEPQGISVEISNVRRGRPINITLEPAKMVIGSADEELQQEVMVAEMYFNEGDFKQAVDEYRKLSEKYPDNNSFKVRIAESHFGMGNYDEAQKMSQEVLRNDPANAGAMTVLGNASLKLNDYQTAYENYAKLVKRFPADAGVWANFAEICLDMQNYEEALMAYRRAIDLNPDYFDLYVRLSAAQMVVNDYAGALETLQTLKEKAPADDPIFTIWNVDELIALCNAELQK